MRERLGKLLEWGKRHPSGVAAGFCLLVAAFCIRHLISHAPPWTLDRLWERHEKLKPAKVDDYIAYGMWVGAAASGAIAISLAATSRWWASPPSGRVIEIAATRAEKVRRFWLWVGIALLIATAFRAPRMDQPLWGDEGWAYQDLMGGRFTQNDDGSLDYRAHDWKTTLFWDKGMNNQYLFSVAARACNDLWRSLSGAPDHAFSETALRIPALAAGLLSIAALAALLKALGLARSGIALAFLLAIHPWHIRYSAEARSYTLLILALAIALLCLVRALSTDRRRWWLCFAIAEFAGLYAWKAAIHPFAAIHLAVLVILIVRMRGHAIVPAMRSLAAGALALMAFFPLFAPAMPQIALALKKSELMRAPLSFDWLATVWSQTLAAMDWGGTPNDSRYQTVGEMAADSPFLTYGFFLVLVPGLILLGLIRLARISPNAAALVAAPLFGGCLAVAHFMLNGTFMHKWYLFYTMPFLMAFAAISVSSLRPAKLPERFVWLPAACFVAFYFLTTLPQTFALVRLPLSDTRAALELTRNNSEGQGTLEPSDHITIGLYRRVTCYDPRLLTRFEGNRIRDTATLRRVLEHADTTGKTLAVTAANLPFARNVHPDLFELLDNESLFEPLGELPAIEAYIRIACWRYRPRSLSSIP